MYDIKFIQDAVIDARQYVNYVRYHQKSPDAARKWYRGLHVAIDTLREFPSRHRILDEAQYLGFSYRCLVYYSHSIIYTVDDENLIVTIHRIWHNSRDNLVIPGVM